MTDKFQTRLAALGRRSKIGLLAAAFIIVGVVGKWGISATLVQEAIASEQLLRHDAETNNQSLANAKATLVGSYQVTGTDPDGVPYTNTRIVAISLAASGALEFDWDNGTFVGVGQLIDDFLAVAYSIKGRTVISVMKVNPDGSLSGTWLRRTDRGSKGTEIWKKT